MNGDSGRLVLKLTYVSPRYTVAKKPRYFCAVQSIAESRTNCRGLAMEMDIEDGKGVRARGRALPAD